MNISEICISANQRQNVETLASIWDCTEFCIIRSLLFYNFIFVKLLPEVVDDGRFRNGSQNCTAVTITYVLYDGGIYDWPRLALSF